MTTAKKGDTNGVVAAAEPMVVRVEMNRLTIGDIAAAEALAGVSFDYATEPDKPRGLIYQALACVVQQRVDPGFTFDDAAGVVVHVVNGQPVPPTNGRAPSTRSRSARTSRS